MIKPQYLQSLPNLTPQKEPQEGHCSLNTSCFLPIGVHFMLVWSPITLHSHISPLPCTAHEQQQTNQSPQPLPHHLQPVKRKNKIRFLEFFLNGTEGLCRIGCLRQILAAPKAAQSVLMCSPLFHSAL